MTASIAGELLVFADVPAARLQILFSCLNRQVLERRTHRVVPAIQVTKQCDDPHDLDDILV